MKILLSTIFILMSSTLLAADGNSSVPGQTATLAKWGLVGTCFMIGILRVLASEAIDGQLKLNWMPLLTRLLFVTLFINYAGAIQGNIWGTAQSIGNSLMPGASLVDVNLSLKNRIDTLKNKKMAEPKKEGSILSGDIAGNLMSSAYNFMSQGLEYLAITIFFLLYQFLQSAQNAVMLFLAAMAPYVLAPSIIPGVNTWSSWLKMVCAVALWPVVAGFLIKGQMTTAAEFLSGSSSGGALETVMSGNADNLYLNLDSLGLLSQSIVYGFMILSSPMLSAAIVYGSAFALGGGASMLLAAGASHSFTKSQMGGEYAVGKVSGAAASISNGAGAMMERFKSSLFGSGNESKGGQSASAKYADSHSGISSTNHPANTGKQSSSSEPYSARYGSQS